MEWVGWAKSSWQHRILLDLRSWQPVLKQDLIVCILIPIDRVAYEPERLKQLGEWASKNAFELEDRMGLVSDALTLSKAGMTKTSAALDLIEGLRAEEESE